MQGLANGFYRFSEWAVRLAYVNLLWICFTLLGFGVLGLFPATAAMFAVIREWVNGNHDKPVFRTFWRVYRQEFLKSNIAGFIIVFLGYVISVEYQILRAQSEIPYYIASFGVIAQGILYVIVLTYFFPIFVHFKLKFSQYFKWSFLVGMMHPILTVFLVVVVGVMNVVTFLAAPGMLFFFGGSFSALIMMWGVSKTFSKFEKAELQS